MISLNEIPSSALKEIIALVEKREKLEKEMETLLTKAETNIANIPAPSKQKKLGIVQPSLTVLITGILTEAKKPMTVQEIYQAGLDKGYQWRSGNPINALNVKMYTSKAFRKSWACKFVSVN